jgi:hypothetical protein
LLPLARWLACCGAARQTGLSLQVLDPAMAELTVCGQTRPMRMQQKLRRQRGQSDDCSALRRGCTIYRKRMFATGSKAEIQNGHKPQVFWTSLGRDNAAATHTYTGPLIDWPQPINFKEQSS